MSNKDNIIRPFKKKKASILVVIILFLVLIASVYAGSYLIINNLLIENIKLSDAIEVIKDDVDKSDEDKQIKSVIIKDSYVDIDMKNGKIKRAMLEPSKPFTELLQESGVEDLSIIPIEYKQSIGVSLDAILSLATFVLFVFGGYILIKSLQVSGSKMNAFGKSPAKLLVGKKTNVTFKDVAGMEEAKEEVREIVEFLKSPKKFFKLGARIPRGVLLVGPPGSGKTLLARAVAGEANVPFFHTSGAEFEEMLVGAGAARVRDLFRKARRIAPCIVFIDEIDAVAKKRDISMRASYTEQTLNQILVEMDGFDRFDTVIVLAATNRPDILDPAILRPGRFDRKIVINIPTLKERLGILRIHTKGKPLADNVDLEVIARKTIGLGGAELENIMNEAAILAVRRKKTKIDMEDLDESLMKVAFGPKKKGIQRTKETLKRTAYHEAGHAIVAHFTEGADPIYKVSIISRGSMGGVTMMLPEKDKEFKTSQELRARIRVATGGRVAEEIIFGDIGTGAAADIKESTRMAKQYVKEYGMSDKLGFVNYGGDEENKWLRYMGDPALYSEETAREIDLEVKKLIMTEYKKAKSILSKYHEKLDQLVQILLKQEVIGQKEFEKLMK